MPNMGWEQLLACTEVPFGVPIEVGFPYGTMLGAPSMGGIVYPSGDEGFLWGLY